VNAEYNVDHVGTQIDTQNPALPDADHEGHGGYRVDQIQAGIDDWLSSIDDPDVILLLIGTNDFFEGYDERQYNSPGFKLPVGALMRTPNGRYEQYHTSDTIWILSRPRRWLDRLKPSAPSHDGKFLNLSPRGEPELG
jgi:hypothetical protein